MKCLNTKCDKECGVNTITNEPNCCDKTYNINGYNMCMDLDDTK